MQTEDLIQLGMLLEKRREYRTKKEASGFDSDFDDTLAGEMLTTVNKEIEEICNRAKAYIDELKNG